MGIGVYLHHGVYLRIILGYSDAGYIIKVPGTCHSSQMNLSKGVFFYFCLLLNGRQELSCSDLNYI